MGVKESQCSRSNRKLLRGAMWYTYIYVCIYILNPSLLWVANAIALLSLIQVLLFSSTFEEIIALAPQSAVF